MKIYIMIWDTESGDSGTAGYWRKRPAAKYLKKFIAEGWPDDDEAQTFNYVIEELAEVQD